MKLTLSKHLHAQMVELSRRSIGDSGERVGVFYHRAISAWLKGKTVPKQLEVIDRHQYRFDVPEELPPLMVALSRIARKRKLELPVLTDEIIEEFLQRPENYLDKEFYKKFKKRFE